jgi:hypothetical protein
VSLMLLALPPERCLLVSAPLCSGSWAGIQTVRQVGHFLSRVGLIKSSDRRHFTPMTCLQPGTPTMRTADSFWYGSRQITHSSMMGTLVGSRMSVFVLMKVEAARAAACGSTIDAAVGCERGVV